MKAIAIVPARMGSSRFPGKPLADIHGLSMVGHCAFRTRLCQSLIGTYVATCDQEIFDAISRAGGEAVMTSPSHERATDRCAEAMLKIEANLGFQVDIVVMVQGDEPMVTPEMIEASLAPFRGGDASIQVVNLMAPMHSAEEFEDPNEVKVVVDRFDNAIYFSREPIPSRRKGAVSVPMLKQVCIIPFRRDFLLAFNAMPQTPLEIIESVDMMRIIENGGKVRMVLSNTDTLSVDTPADLERVRVKMTADPLMRRYIR
ncbi:MAG: 3-deoxy-manno-octulosonate cytidylyltransferase [Magnetococcales bacterium]|nr:3-deoxy-manno-octulosonate cytidylyltransferase [Magnetococcales bacterium]